MKQFYPFVSMCAFLVGSFFLPQAAQAAEVIFEAKPGPETTIEVRIDPQSKAINVVEGAILFEGGQDLKVKFDTSDSVFTLWPTAPTYVPERHALRFVGGVPNGIAKEGVLLRMRLLSQKQSDLTISWIGGMAYLNDGKGTSEGVDAKPITIHLDGKADAFAFSSTESHVSGLSFKAGGIIVVVLLLFFAAYRYGQKRFSK